MSESMESCDKLLGKHVGVLAFLVALGLLVVVAGVILCIKKMLPKPLTVFLACCTLVFAVPTVYIVRGFQDLHNQDYEIYYGSFTVSERYQSNGNLTLQDEDQTFVRMEGGDFPLSNGEHTGYVVYAKRTRLLLLYDPYESPLVEKN